MPKVVNFLKNLIFLLVLSFLLLTCSRGEHYIKIKGSDSVLPIAQKEAEVYMESFPYRVVTVTGGGSGVGIAALLDGTTHIAMASREIKVAEKLRLQDIQKSITEKIIAYDALAIIINPSNPIEQLTREEIEKIYTGKIRNWQELGGADQALVAYARETSSGTYEYFKQKVLEDREYDASILSLASNGAIIQSVSQTPGAIGYVGLAYLNPDIKTINVSFDQGKSYVSPTFDNAQKNIYPISRPLYFYYDSQLQEKVNPFLDFTFSKPGQEIIKDIGYVPVN